MWFETCRKASFKNIQVALSLDAVIHIDRIIHVEIDPATQVDA